jgi:hypothetical protein
MRKKILDASAAAVDVAPRSDDWLDVPQIAAVEMSSEDPLFPVESVFQGQEGIGWRADQDGEQLLRLIFKEPVRLHHVQLQFVEKEHERTQEFSIRWSSAQGAPLQEIVRQQWTFSPAGSTSEIEDYAVSLENVAVVELFIRPDLQAGRGRATLSKWRLA